METSRIALITGATAGIGEATAFRFAEAGWRLILTGRRAERLQALRANLPTEVLTLQFDVRDRAAVEFALAELPLEWAAIDLLVNNAGLARGLAPVDAGDPNDWDEMLLTNVSGLAYVTRVVAAGMRQRGRGHIINVGSIAGKEAYPNGAMYCATKHAVDAFTQGLRMDLLGSGVRVGAVHPGLVNTEFSTVRFHGDAARADSVYNGMVPLTGADVAEAIYFMASAPAHVNVADLLLLPTDQASATQVYRRP